MTNVHVTDSDEDTIVDFVKANEQWYDKTSEHFKDKARKVSLLKELAKSRKLSIKVLKTWFDSQRTRYQSLDRPQKR